jgi:predicted phage terminase large subunit-like protein
MMRELVTSAWYQELWPLKLAGDQNEKLFFENEKRGFRQACAVSSMTGRRAGCVVWDDALNPEKAHSETHRETAIRVLKETLPTRLSDPEKSAIIIVMQRLHENDPSGYILSNDLGYDHLCLPMEFDPSRRRVTSIGWTDPRTEDGELLFPGRFPREVVERDKKAMGDYATAGQFQQLPAPMGGGIFKTDWWRFYSIPPRLKWRAIYGDTALKTKEQNDYSVFQCWGESVDGQAVMLDQARGKWEAPELLVQARAFWNKHKMDDNGTLRAFKVEDKASGTGLIQTLKREGVPIIGIQRSIDKITRAMDAAPLMQSGNVILPENAPWLADYLAEFAAFPNGTHDDQADPAMDAIKDILTTKNAIGIWEKMT